MKKILILAVLAMMAVGSANAQTKKAYCEIVGVMQFMSTKVKVYIDLGESEKAWHDHQLVDENGEKIKFSSMIEALNYMSDRGWELEQAYSAVSEKSSATRYIMSKVIFEGETKSDGITTKHTFKESTN